MRRTLLALMVAGSDACLTLSVQASAALPVAYHAITAKMDDRTLLTGKDLTIEQVAEVARCKMAFHGALRSRLAGPEIFLPEVTVAVDPDTLRISGLIPS